MLLKLNDTFFKGLGRLTRHYWQSEERWSARFLLAVIISLNLGDVYILVKLNEWNNMFYNALQKYNRGIFFRALGDFSILAAIFIVISVYELYFQQMLEIKWRRWMTEHYLTNWLKKQSYYLLQLKKNNTDNPDQRISEDIRLFVSSTLSLSIGLLKATVTLFSFIIILWKLSGSLKFPFVHNQIIIPGYMVWAAVGYAIIGTWLTSKIGRSLVKLNFDQQCYEADFRFSLVRLRENSESIAFYRGEQQEQANFITRFKRVFGNFRALMLRQKKLTWFTSGYSQIAIIFPFLVAAPRYFSRQIQLGGLVQIATAFGRVQDALSFFVDSYASLAEWQAVVNRLIDFNTNIDLVDTISEKTPIQVTDSTESTLTVSGLEVGLPNGTMILNNLEFKLNQGDTLLITGPSGSGKSTLMRTLAGIWPFAKGQISIPQREGVLFLPQKSYLPLGTLREVLLFPRRNGWETDKILQEILVLCKLNELTEQLDLVENWSQVLSLGEQQRIAFARTLLQQPKWLFLDEATSALDEPTEGIMYRLLQERLKNAAIISVGHRQSLISYHKRRLHLDGIGKWTMLDTNIPNQADVPFENLNFSII